jgi:Antitoxin VbhA
LSPNPKFDLEGWWPEAFEGLTTAQRWNVIQACAANWHEGWEPNRPDVQNLCDVVRGTITPEEYLDRAMAIVNAEFAERDKLR